MLRYSVELQSVTQKFPHAPELLRLGWSEFFQSQLSADELTDATVARVVEPLRGLSRVAAIAGEMWAENAESAGVGDWVVGTIRSVDNDKLRFAVTRVLNRKTKLSRKPPSGKKHEQILCANADTVFIVAAMNQFLQFPGIQRAITAATMGGVQPVLVLTKADVCEDGPAILQSAKQTLPGIAIHPVSIRQQTGVEALKEYFGNGRTVVLLGASGAGKSTLTNHFTQSQNQLVGDTRESDEKGRHTTTARHLHLLASGGMIVDSPGIRELQLWQEPEGPAKPRNKKHKQPRRSSGRYRQEDDE